MKQWRALSKAKRIYLTTCRPQSPEDEDRKVRRREKNRVAAQRSRRKQTQKADKLHEVRLWSGQDHRTATGTAILCPGERGSDDVTIITTNSACLILLGLSSLLF